MVSIMKKSYEELKSNRSISLNYDEILLFYPDYFKTKVLLENETFVSKEKVDKDFDENYKGTALYNKLVQLAMADDEIYEFMKHNKDFKYDCIKSIFDRLVQSTIQLCELIDYIGHYPTTYPVPNEEEKNPIMEELFEKYDIIIRYYLNDWIDEMQIASDDVVRIIEKLQKNLEVIHKIKEKMSTNNWLFTRSLSDEKRSEKVDIIISDIEDFPLSIYQEQHKSRREEAKRYLRLQHGEDII